MEKNSTKWKKQDAKLLPIMWSNVLNQNKKSVSFREKKMRRNLPKFHNHYDQKKIYVKILHVKFLCKNFYVKILCKN